MEYDGPISLIFSKIFDEFFNRKDQKKRGMKL